MTQGLHLNDQPTHIQSNPSFERESFEKLSQYTRGRHGRKPSKSEKEGEQLLKNDEYLNRLEADRELQGSPQVALPPWISRIEGWEDATVTVSDAGRRTHVESEGMNFREFKARVIRVLYDPITTRSNYAGVHTARTGNS